MCEITFKSNPVEPGGIIYVDALGVETALHDLYIKEWVSTGVGDVEAHYKIVGPKGQETLDFLKKVHPEVRWVDPERERVEAYHNFIEQIRRDAVEQYKRENGIE